MYNNQPTESDQDVLASLLGSVNIDHPCIER